MSLEDARWRLAWPERLIYNLQLEKKEGAIVQGAGSIITMRKKLPTHLMIHEHSCPSVSRKLIKIVARVWRSQSRCGGSKTFQETWGLGDSIRLNSTHRQHLSSALVVQVTHA